MRGEEVLMRPRPPSDSTEGTACKPSYELDQYWSRDHLHLWVIGWLVRPLYCDGGGRGGACEPVVIFHIYLGSVSHFCSYTLLIITIMIQLLNTNKLPLHQPGPWPVPFKIIVLLWNCSVIDTRGFVVWLVSGVVGEGRRSDVTSCHEILIYNTRNVSSVKHNNIKLCLVVQYNFIIYGNWWIPSIKYFML